MPLYLYITYIGPCYQLSLPQSIVLVRIPAVAGLRKVTLSMENASIELVQGNLFPPLKFRSEMIVRESVPGAVYRLY
jgi:hypothetical protein